MAKRKRILDLDNLHTPPISTEEEYMAARVVCGHASTDAVTAREILDALDLYEPLRVRKLSA